MLITLCSNMIPHLGAGLVSVRYPQLGSALALTYRAYVLSARWAPSPRIHGVRLSVRTKSIKRTADGEIALQRWGWPRHAGLALEKAAWWTAEASSFL